MLKSNLKFLYFFENADKIVLEVKKMNMPHDTPPSEVYHWLYYIKITDDVLKLNFVSMDSTENQELRIFDNARFTFNKEEANLEMFGRKEHYQKGDIQNMPRIIINRVENFLSGE